MSIFGFLDEVHSGSVRGWAKSTSGDELLVAELLIDGIMIARCDCDLLREDLLVAGIGDGFSGFAFEVDGSRLCPESHAVVIVRDASGHTVKAERRPLDNSSVEFTPLNSGQDTQHPQSVPASNEMEDPSSMQSHDVIDGTLAEVPMSGLSINSHVQALATDDEGTLFASGVTASTGAVVPDQSPANTENAEREGMHSCIDAINAECVRGWAFRVHTPNEPVLVEILVDNKVVGEAVSEIYRKDLEISGIGSGSHGFQFDFPKGLFVGRPQHVLVRDKLTGLQLHIGDGVNAVVEKDTRFAGAADNFSDGTISGWALNYRERDRPVELAVYVGSKLVGRGRTDRYRRDIVSHQGGHGFYGFRIRLNQKTFREDFADLRVMMIAYDQPLRVVASIKENLPTRSVSKETPSVKGFLDRADRQAIAGWAVNEARPDVATTVDIYVNQFLIRSAVAGRTRKDLTASYPLSEGRLGFNYQLPHGHSLRGRAIVSARIAEGNRPTARSPQDGMLGHPGHYLESVHVRRHLSAIRKKQFFEAKKRAGYEPHITAIVLNRDGENFLEDLFSSIDRYSTYPNLEIIVVDHGSTDRSRAVCNRWSDKLTIKFIDRRRNFSYSASNNFGAAYSSAEVLFFLNNDIRFSSDFLFKAVQQLDDDVGIVGFKLASPPEQVRTETGLTRVDLVDVGIAIDQIQHLGVRMTTAAGDRPFLPFEEPLNRNNEDISSQPLEVPCVTAAALLLRRDDFLRVGGFHEEYFYGFLADFERFAGRRGRC